MRSQFHFAVWLQLLPYQFIDLQMHSPNIRYWCVALDLAPLHHQNLSNEDGAAPVLSLLQYKPILKWLKTHMLLSLSKKKKKKGKRNHVAYEAASARRISAQTRAKRCRCLSYSHLYCAHLILSVSLCLAYFRFSKSSLFFCVTHQIFDLSVFI